jgi:hypothetical protein
LALALLRQPVPPAALIVDPIVLAVVGDSHKNADTRRSLQPLVELGERIGCAILGVSHFSKGTAGRDPVERVTGSLAFGALARVVLAAVKTTTDEGAPGPRLFARAKSNNGPSGGGFHYELEQVELAGSAGVFASRVLWGNQVEGEAHMLLAAAEQADDPGERSAVSDAMAWLVGTLTDAGGEMNMRDVMTAGRKAGFSERSIHRARSKAGVRATVAGFGADKRSIWNAPLSVSVPPIVPIMPTQKVGTNGTNAGNAGMNEPADEGGEVF